MANDGLVDRRQVCRILIAGAGAMAVAPILSACNGNVAAPLCPGTGSDAGTCNGTDVGPPAAITLDTIVPATDPCGNLFFVVRDANGIFALTSICTHAGCAVNVQGQGFSCSCHGATFDEQGNVTSGPASSPLEHYPCALVNGHVCVDTSRTVTADVRLVA
jgi:thiosulfate dehydrogenase [quinone] large subunit